MIKVCRSRRLTGLLLLLLLADPARAKAQSLPRVDIVPRPVTAESSAGSFRFSRQTHIVAADPEARRIAAMFTAIVRMRGGPKLSIGTRPPREGNFVSFTSSGSEQLPAEGYQVIVGSDEIRIVGREAGLYYGMQTLTQLLPADVPPMMELTNAKIIDYPRFGYRGLLVDVGRHFFPASYLKKLIDLAAQYKINRLQWHLTDNEGWRIQIKQYPRLTGPRPGTPGQDPADARYYTQQQVREIVSYAQARFITVIPEIEMPGHSGAALAAYPQLACPGGDPQVLCPTDEAFKFVQEVLGEVVALFPSPYVHIGGDEVDKRGWRNSPVAQTIMKQQGLKDEDQLQSYFVKRVGKFLPSRGKRMIGWDEIMEGGLAADAVVMSWRGELGGIEAAREGHQVVMAPTDYTYFDYNQGDPSREPANIGGYVPLAKAYGYDPLPRELPQDKRAYVLGAQANVWTEYIATPDYLEYMLFPRLLAFAEAVWSPLARKDYPDFRRRLPEQLQRLGRQGVNYRIPEPDGLNDFYTTTDDHAHVELNSLVRGSRMFYTLDGSEPSEASLPYQAPFDLPLQPGQKTVLHLMVQEPGGRKSVVYEASFLVRPLVNALDEAPREPGLSYVLVDAKLNSARNVLGQTPTLRGVTDSFDLKQFNRSSDYGVSYAGFLFVQADGYYQFAVESDDGSVLTIDDEVIVDNDGRHAAHTVKGYIPLRKGLHKFGLEYFQAGEAASLNVSWAPAGTELQPLPGTVLSH
jgi:hexosaminidase